MSRGRGRPSGLTKETRDEIAKHITTGATEGDACELAGVARATYFTWKAKGEQQERGEYRDFLDALEAAKVKRRQFWRAKILKLGDEKKDWKAFAHVAALTDREHFAQRIHIEVDRELAVIAARVEKAFDGEPELVERILLALSGGET